LYKLFFVAVKISDILMQHYFIFYAPLNENSLMITICSDKKISKIFDGD